MNLKGSLVLVGLALFLFSCGRKNLAIEGGKINVSYLTDLSNGKVDAAELQKLINSAGPAVEIYFPEGVYALKCLRGESILHISNKSSISIIGDGLLKTFIIGENISNKVVSSIFQIRNVENVYFEGLTLKAKNMLNVSKAPTERGPQNKIDYNIHKAVYILGDEANSLSFYSIGIENFSGIGLHVTPKSKEVVLDSCRFKNLMRAPSKATGVQSYKLQPTGALIANAKKAIISNSTFRDIVDFGPLARLSHAVYLSNVLNTVVENNSFSNDSVYVLNNNSGGLQIEQGQNSGIKVRNNIFNNVTSHLNDTKGLLVFGNTFVNARMHMRSVSDVSIEQNVFTFNKPLNELIGIVTTRDNVERVVFDNNRFSYNGPKSSVSCAFQIYGNGNGITLNENLFERFGYSILSGINKKAKSISNVLIIKNTFSPDNSSSSYGVNIKSGDGFIIKGNIVDNKVNKSFRFVSNDQLVQRNKKPSIEIKGNKQVGKEIIIDIKK